jgi:Flp pilus assembly pilin Flp
MFGLRLYGCILALATRAAAHAARDERGQATAEYALIIAAAAIIGGVVIAWAARSGLLAQLLNATLGRVIDTVKA